MMVFSGRKYRRYELLSGVVLAAIGLTIGVGHAAEKTARARKREAQAKQQEQPADPDKLKAARMAYAQMLERLQKTALRRLAESKPPFTEEDLETFERMKTAAGYARRMNAFARTRSKTQEDRWALLKRSVGNYRIQQRVTEITNREDAEKLANDPLIDLSLLLWALKIKVGEEHLSTSRMRRGNKNSEVQYQLKIKGEERVYHAAGLRKAFPDICDELKVFLRLHEE